MFGIVRSSGGTVAPAQQESCGRAEYEEEMHHVAINAVGHARERGNLCGGAAQTGDELKNDEKTPGDVLTYGMGYSHQRFSPLTHINRDNVQKLVPAWAYSMADNNGQQSHVLVKDGIMYVTDHVKTVALDALTGKAV
jgi:glucose dehydrogenase